MPGIVIVHFEDSDQELVNCSKVCNITQQASNMTMSKYIPLQVFIQPEETVTQTAVQEL